MHRIDAPRNGRRRISRWIAAVLVATSGCSPPPEPAASDAPALLAELVEEVERRNFERDPLLALQAQLPVEHLRDVSYAAARRDHYFRRSLLERLRRIERGALSREELLTWEILEWDLGMTIEGFQHFWPEPFLMPLVYSWFYSPEELLKLLPIESPEDAERFLRLAAEVPGVIEALHERLRGQYERGIVVPRPALASLAGLLDSHVAAPEDGPYRLDGEQLAAAGLGEDEVRELQGRLARLVDEEITPAWRRLRDFVAGDYAAAAPEQVGLSQYEGGEAYYRYLVRLRLSFDLPPEDIHQVGLDRIADNEGRMAEIRRELSWEGDKASFHQFLKTDPRFFPRSPDEVGERLLRAARAMEERLGELVLEKPRTPYGVRRSDPRYEANLSYGYYEPPRGNQREGIYFYNGSRLDERSWLNLEGLSFHELLPGHHLQTLRQQENEALPDYRRLAYYDAYCEGWASYSTRLGLELDVFSDPYSRYGAYVMEVMLASRLVTDTGMAVLGWSLADAREFLREHTLESETAIAAETIRYSVDMPAQALGYLMGQIRILELRGKARAALGERFDLRRFHEAVVGSGAMPLGVLERHVDRFLEEELARGD